MYHPTLTDPGTSRVMTDTFYGYNRNLKIGDGEWYDMENLTGDSYPLMSRRKSLSTVESMSSPQGILGKEQLAYVDGTRLFYGGKEVDGITLSTAEEMCPKTLVSMGAYIVIFPDKIYYNTEDSSDYGYLERSYTTSEGNSISYSICTRDGGEYGEITVSDTTPAEPTDGQLWIDSSQPTHALKQYSGESETWVQIATTYVKIEAPGIGLGLNEYDGIELSGITGSAAGETLKNQLEALNGTQVVYGCGDDYIIIVGLLDSVYAETLTADTAVTAARTVPDMDFVIEAENRLWGCKYGPTANGVVNEIYCCKLGDFKNWRVYMGISTDAWAASVGTDGAFTGAATHMGYPIFFKEDCLHKVYISTTGAHQIVTTQCRGVQKGSGKSLKVVNETLYYKSRTDICAYDGSLPTSISAALGDKRYSDAVAGSVEGKYFICMTDDETEDRRLFYFDTRKGLWYRWSDTDVKEFTRVGDELYFYDGDKNLRTIFGSAGTKDSDVSWSAQTGLIGYEYPDKKYLSRYNFRMSLPEGSSLDVYIEYDSSDEWIHSGHIDGTGTGTFTLPIRPERCDHMRIKLTGTGEIKLYSIAKVLELGSDV